MQKYILKSGFLWMFSVLTLYSSAQERTPIESRWKDYIDLNQYLQPFWQSDTIYDEAIQIIKENGKAAGKLLYPPRKILSVRAANLSTEYKEGVDWTLQKNKIKLSPESTIPYIDKEDLVFTEKRPKMAMTGKEAGTFVLFSEGKFFRSKQIVVTYIPEKSDQVIIPAPLYVKEFLPNTIEALEQKKNLKVVFFGNSITRGANASGRQNDTPYLPTWPELVVYNLRKMYGEQIDYANKAVGGKRASWGVENVEELVVSENPDLVVLGFGMNDGTANVDPGVFRDQIKTIIDAVRQSNENAEFILVAPMLANPYSRQNGRQAEYKQELDKLKEKGIVVADMTTLHSELLKHKTYQDMTGNNVNHPNDYFVRWYAQVISAFLIKQ